MKSFVEFFRINDKPMFAPDDDVVVSYSDLDSEESGRDESGVMHRIVVQYKMGTWTFTYSEITEEEKRYMESLFPNEPDFVFTHPGRIDVFEETKTRCYRSNYSISWKNAVTGHWRNYKFNIIACEGESACTEI